MAIAGAKFWLPALIVLMSSKEYAYHKDGAFRVAPSEAGSRLPNSVNMPMSYRK